MFECLRAVKALTEGLPVVLLRQHRRVVDAKGAVTCDCARTDNGCTLEQCFFFVYWGRGILYQTNNNGDYRVTQKLSCFDHMEGQGHDSPETLTEIFHDITGGSVLGRGYDCKRTNGVLEEWPTHSSLSYGHGDSPGQAWTR